MRKSLLRLRAPTPAPEHEGFAMDIEHINALGTQLDDLRQRTQALRGYL